jgi:hypothetical protein
MSKISTADWNLRLPSPRDAIFINQRMNVGNDE